MSGAEPVTRIELKKAEKRRRLIAAALELFAERGFHGTAVPLVAERAEVAAGTVYRFFESKEALVNAVFREAKGRLAEALDGLDALDALPARERFAEFWQRLVRFARAEPIAFQFLELQDHMPYLDDESRALELQVLGPMFQACVGFRESGAFRKDVPVDATMAFVWGAFVGLMKAERNGYLKLDDETLRRAGDACFRAFAPDEDDDREA